MRLKNVSRGARLFIAVFLSMLIIVEAGLLMMFRHSMRLETESHFDSAKSTAENMVQQYGQSFSNGAQVINSVFSESWYMHYRNVVGFYDAEFDVATRSRISDSLITMLRAFPYAAEILIVTPVKNEIISTNGWYSVDEYNKIYGHGRGVTISETNTAITVQSKNDDYAVVLFQDYNVRRDSSVIAVLVDKKAFQKSFERSLSGETAFVRATLEGDVLHDSGDREEAFFVVGAEFKSPRFEVLLGYYSYDNSMDVQLFLLYSFVLVLVMILVAMLLSKHFLKPLHSIVVENGGQRKDLAHPYEYVREYISGLKRDQSILSNKVLERTNEMERFMDRARQDIVFGMLTNKDFEVDEDVRLALPWMHENTELFLIAMEKGSEKEALALPVSDEQVAGFVRVRMNDMNVLAVWMAPELTPDEKNEYALYLRYTCQEITERRCVLSPVFSDVQLAAKYMEEIRLALTTGIQQGTSLPEDAREEIKNAVQKGDSETVCAVARALSADYSPEDVLNPVLEAAGLEAKELSGGEEERWASAMEILENITYRYHAEEEKENEEAKEYLKFIDENFRDPEFGILTLSEHFGRHRTLISKAVKAASGMTFTDYLRNLRMDAALSAIENGNRNMMALSKEVGYTSYASFKRAFQMRVGCTPMEYKERIESK